MLHTIKKHSVLILSLLLFSSLNYSFYLHNKIETAMMDSVWKDGILAKRNADSFNVILDFVDPKNNNDVAARGLLENSMLVVIAAEAMIETGVNSSKAYNYFRTSESELEGMRKKAQAVMDNYNDKVGLISPKNN